MAPSLSTGIVQAAMAPPASMPQAVMAQHHHPHVVTMPSSSTGVERVTSGNPPQKSELTHLCERFQFQFGHLQPDGSPTLLMLNDVAEALGVPRRRLYDVINVFESIEVMKRVGKLMYEFCGYDHLPALLHQLASDEESGVPVEDRVRRAPTAATTSASAQQQQNNAAAAAAAAAVAAATAAAAAQVPAAAAASDPTTAAAAVASAAPAATTAEEPPSGRSTSHSLWVLSRRLVRMLLKNEGPIALTAAAAELVGPSGVSDPSQHRSQTQITVERRLYDIGSILCSLGLVERVYIKKRQPAFEWVYGWRPGDAHQPPELAVATLARQPAPPLALIPRRPEDMVPRTGRRGGRGRDAAGAGLGLD